MCAFFRPGVAARPVGAQRGRRYRRHAAAADHRCRSQRGIPDITTIENNVHAGAKYLRFLRDRYFSDPAVDLVNQTLFAFAAYNAGPANVRQLREEAARTGLDPNLWFGHVEHVAAKRIGRETVQYVSDIAKYYVAYRLASRQLEERGSERG